MLATLEAVHGRLADAVHDRDAFISSASSHQYSIAHHRVVYRYVNLHLNAFHVFSVYAALPVTVFGEVDTTGGARTHSLGSGKSVCEPQAEKRNKGLLDHGVNRAQDPVEHLGGDMAEFSTSFEIDRLLVADRKRHIP